MLLDYLKTLPQYLLPKHGLTALAGYLADLKKPLIKNQLIRYFIRKYQVDMREALEENPEHYACFNDFFIRHLKPECRPIATADIVSPVDGYISEIGQIKAGQLLQAKGKKYSVQELLGCSAEQSAQFENGCFATLYLSPKDYHRIHMPLEGTLKEMIYMPGSLFSVQPSTVRIIPKLFARNERVAAFFDTNAGLMAMVLVGATIVGGIATSWHGDVIRSSTQAHFSYSQESTEHLAIEKAAEMGYFKLGSTVVLLFANHHHVQWLDNWHAGDRILLGQALGSISISPT